MTAAVTRHEQRRSRPETQSASEPGTAIVWGHSEASAKLRDHLLLVAPTNMSVLITGESGTGKEYAARFIHANSKRKARPFVAVDCGVLSRELAASELFGHAKGAFTSAVSDKKGVFETAEGGTVFLDEIGNLPYDVQVQLLRAIQERVIRPVGSVRETAVDVRIIAATNENLLEASTARTSSAGTCSTVSTNSPWRFPRSGNGKRTYPLSPSRSCRTPTASWKSRSKDSTPRPPHG